MNNALLSQIEGAMALSEWLGGFPTMRDATVTDFQIRGDGSGHLRASASRTNGGSSEPNGSRVEKRCLVTLRFEGISQVELAGFDSGTGVLFGLDISKPGDEFICELSASSGVAGQIKARVLSVSFSPVDAQAAA